MRSRDSVAGGWWNAEELLHESRFVASHEDAKPGEELYCISVDWLRKWKRHVERMHDHDDHHHHHHRLHIHFPHLHLHHHHHHHHDDDDHHHHNHHVNANDVPHPGAITNWDLLDPAWHYERMKQGLQVGRDYEVVSRAVWNFLQPRYRGGPAITVPASGKGQLFLATIYVSQVCDFQSPDMTKDTDADAGQGPPSWTIGSWSSGIDSVSKSVRNMLSSRSGTGLLTSPRSSSSGNEICESLPVGDSPLTQPEEQRALAADGSAAHKAKMRIFMAMKNHGAQRRSPLEEYHFVALNDIPQEGQKWHFIDNGWLKQWRNHVLHQGPHPGPVRNWELLEENMDKPTPKRDLVAGKHYRGLGPAAWNLLIETYGGGPCITSEIMSIYAADNLEEDIEGDEPQEELWFSGCSQDSAHDGDHSSAPRVHHEPEGAHSSKPVPWRPMASSSSVSTASSVSSMLKALVTAPMKQAKGLLGGKTFEV